MIGVIVLPGSSPAMHGLDQHAPLSLLPLVDRPILQHAIELLVLSGITQFEIVLEHAPERVEEYFGDGTRWGCRFRYHLSTQIHQPYRVLKGLSELEAETWVLFHGDQFPCTNFAKYQQSSKPVLFSATRDIEHLSWRGAAVFPIGSLDSQLLSFTENQFGEYLSTAAIQKHADVALVEHWIDARSPAHLLQTQSKLLNRIFTDLMISGTESDAGVWISRNVTIHPSVKIVPPVYLGQNCRLNSGAEVGPNAVISKNSMIDSRTMVRNALITSGSYIGEHLELDEVIVDRNLLASAKFDTGVSIAEDFLLGHLVDSPRRKPLTTAIESIVALLLLVILSPLWILIRGACSFTSRYRWISKETVALPASSDSRFWKTFSLPFIGATDADPQPRAGWWSFITRFVPGLPFVFLGKLSLVGLPPRSPEEIHRLPPDWKTLYLNGRAGLITEVSLAAVDGIDENTIYFAEAFHIASQGWRANSLRFLRYFAYLVLLSKTQHDDGLEMPADRSTR